MRIFARAALLVTLVSVAATPASAHRGDLMSPHRAGPIVRNETTLPEMRSSFGRPDDKSGVTIGCSPLIEARWNPDITAYLSRTTPRIVVATFIRSRTITSAEHGDLTIHTARGLRIGNSESRLRTLYPNARPMTHAGHTHYRLRTARDGSFLMAKVVGDGVVRFENWPFEFC